MTKTAHAAALAKLTAHARRLGYPDAGSYLAGRGSWETSSTLRRFGFR